MSIFTRRAIQQRLDSLVRTVGKSKLRRMVNCLNIEGSESNEKRVLESLAMAWEAVIVSAFTELGDTKYEVAISNGKTPDFLFCGQGVSLMGDVVTVSDEQQHKKNPVDEFSAIIGKVWHEFGLSRGSLSWNVESVDLDPPAAPKVANDSGMLLHLSSRLRSIKRGPVKRLLLPPQNKLNEYVRKKLYPFFYTIRKSPDKPHILRVNEQYDPETIVSFSITYSPEGKYFSGSCSSYTAVTDIERHVLWRRLIEKSTQFADASEKVPRVLFVCDGGCSALSTSWGGCMEYRLEEILDHLWKRPTPTANSCSSWITEKHISAVVALSIGTIPLVRREFALNARLFTNPHCQFPLSDIDVKLLDQVVSKLPVPIESPSNAMRSMRKNPISSRYKGDLTMSQKKVEISAVELLRILAGEISIEDFCRSYKLDTNPFKEALRRFQTIKSVQMTPLANRDDDTIIIEFGPHDAAVGPLRIPTIDKE